MQQRIMGGEKDRYTIIKYEYGNPMTLQAVKNGKLIRSFAFDSPADLNLEVANCGANNYFYHNRTIHFVLTNEPDCQINI